MGSGSSNPMPLCSISGEFHPRVGLQRKSCQRRGCMLPHGRNRSIDKGRQARLQLPMSVPLLLIMNKPRTSISNLYILNSLPNLHDCTRALMAQHDGTLQDEVPNSAPLPVFQVSMDFQRNARNKFRVVYTYSAHHSRIFQFARYVPEHHAHFEV